MKITFHKVLAACLMLGLGVGFAACSDFVDQDSDRVIFADHNHLTDAEDTLYSVVGIVNKLQAIADRTVLLGEVRGDLVDINSNTSADLRNVALFNVDAKNAYNQPSDYYAVINNCNYFLANADSLLKNGRNEYIFRKEIAVVKAYRAWTYMQLALNYGSVPFVTTPILSEADANKDYPRYDMKQICAYFVNDLQGTEQVETPDYGTMRGVDSKLFYFPVYCLLGDMNLWLGNYREAALCYYHYLTGNGSAADAKPLGTYKVYFMPLGGRWQFTIDSWSSQFQTVNAGNQIITVIPGDSIPSEGNYSQLRNLYNSSAANNYKVSLNPSQSLFNLSASQTYCYLTEAGNVIYAPKGLENNNDGDLRLSACYRSTHIFATDNKLVDAQMMDKFIGRNVLVYRRALVYLRMAEALNRAGFPRFAFAILKTGVNNDVLKSDVLPYYAADSTWLKQFSFPNAYFVKRTQAQTIDENTMGLHSIGSGWSEYNEHYVLPDDSTLTGQARLDYQVKGVEDLIMDEEGLEFAFEGYRFYDLMRVAMRRNNPAYLADRVYRRRGEAHVGEMKGLIKKDLYQTANWYLPLK